MIMGLKRVGMPIVEVIAPDGSRELWVAAVEHSKAVAAVRRKLPPGHIAKLRTAQGYRRNSRMEGFHYGQVRKIQP
jgi:hypothetical protein